MKTLYRCAFCAVAVLAAFTRADSARSEMISAVATQGAGQFLIAWDSSTPGTLVSARFIQSANVIMGLDARPSTQDLYVLSEAQIGEYQVSQLLPFENGTIGVSIVGSDHIITGFSHGFDFNPVIDRVRVVNDVNKNYVFNPNDSLVQLVATDLAYGPADPNFGNDPNVGGVAYTNSTVAVPASTQLYGIDTGLNILVTQANNAGTLGTVGSLGVDVSALAGFDISGATGVAYAAMTPAGSSQSIFYSIDLATGAATAIGPIGGGIVVTAMTVGNIPIPEPSTAALASLMLTGLAGIRRRVVG